MKETFRLLF